MRAKVPTINCTYFNCRFIYNKTFLKTKVRSYGDESPDLHEEEIPKVGSNYTYLAVILIDFVLKKMRTAICKCFFKKIKHIE